MSTLTQTHRSATWRSDARLRSHAHATASMLGNFANGTAGHNATCVTSSTYKVTFPAIAPTRRGAPPL